MKEINGKRLFGYMDNVRLTDEMKSQLKADLIARTKEINIDKERRDNSNHNKILNTPISQNTPNSLKAPKTKKHLFFGMKQAVSAAAAFILLTGVWIFANFGNNGNSPDPLPVPSTDNELADNASDNTGAAENTNNYGIAGNTEQSPQNGQTNEPASTAISADSSRTASGVNSERAVANTSAQTVKNNAQTPAVDGGSPAVTAQPNPHLTGVAVTQPPLQTEPAHTGSAAIPPPETVPPIATEPNTPVTDEPPVATEPATEPGFTVQPPQVTESAPVSFLNLSYQQIDDQKLEEMVSDGEIPPEVVGLDLSGNPISDLSPLAELSNLEELYLPQNLELTDISPLNELENLSTLSLGYNFIPPEQVKELLRRRPRLRLRDYHKILYNFID